MSKLIGVHVPADIKNIAINGNMDFFQRNEGNASTVSASTASVSAYVADMFQWGIGGASAKSVSVTRSTNVPTQAQSNWQSVYSMQFQNTAALATLASGDYYNPINYRMEGQDYAKIHGKIATVGFWFSTTLAGLYPIAFRNGAFNRSYVTTFNAVVGWQYVMVTLQMDTSAGGTWNFDNTIGLDIVIGAATGSTYQTSIVNAWQSGVYSTTPSTLNWAATSGATLNIAQFSVVEGPVGFGPKGFERAGDSIQAELSLSQRYYEKTYDLGVAPGTVASNGPYYLICLNATDLYSYGFYSFRIPKRTAPTISGWDPLQANDFNVFWDYSAGARNGSLGTANVGTTSIGRIYNISNSWGANRLVAIHLCIDAGL